MEMKGRRGEKGGMNRSRNSSNAEPKLKGGRTRKRERRLMQKEGRDGEAEGD